MKLLIRSDNDLSLHTNQLFCVNIFEPNSNDDQVSEYEYKVILYDELNVLRHKIIKQKI